MPSTVAQSTVTGEALAVSVTVAVAVTVPPVPSVIETLPMARPSSSRMLPLAVARRMPAAAGRVADSVTVKASFASESLSAVIGTEKVRLVCPALKVSVPEVAV